MDAQCRAKVAQAIVDFLEGKINNFQLDDTLHSDGTEDKLCAAIRDQLWFFYDDVRHHFNRDRYALTPAAVALWHRWHDVLCSDLEWEDEQIAKPRRRSNFYERHIAPRLNPKPLFKANPYWPFRGQAEWHAFKEERRRNHRPK